MLAPRNDILMQAPQSQPAVVKMRRRAVRLLVSTVGTGLVLDGGFRVAAGVSVPDLFPLFLDPAAIMVRAFKNSPHDDLRDRSHLGSSPNNADTSLLTVLLL